MTTTFKQRQRLTPDQMLTEFARQVRLHTDWDCPGFDHVPKDHDDAIEVMQIAMEDLGVTMDGIKDILNQYIAMLNRS